MANVIGMEDLEDAKTFPVAEGNNVMLNDSRNEIAKAGNLAVRVLSRLRSNDCVDPGPPPDGGLQAWSMAFAAHLILFNTWGVSSTSLQKLILSLEVSPTGVSTILTGDHSSSTASDYFRPTTFRS